MHQNWERDQAHILKGVGAWQMHVDIFVFFEYNLSLFSANTLVSLSYCGRELGLSFKVAGWLAWDSLS